MENDKRLLFSTHTRCISHKIIVSLRQSKLRMQLRKEGRPEVSEPEAPWISSCQGLCISKRPGISHSPSTSDFPWTAAVGRAGELKGAPLKYSRWSGVFTGVQKPEKQRELPNNVQRCQSMCKPERSIETELTWCGKHEST